MSLIAAHTTFSPAYPSYVNISEGAEGSVSITVRGDPVERDGSYICGFAADKGRHGRCTPGDEHCNNYCNMAPQAGPMADAPKPCRQTISGDYAWVTLTADAWAALRAQILLGD